MAEDEDRELRRLFAVQRRDELEAAPPFRRVWAAARANVRPRRRARLAAAAAAALTLTLLAFLWRRPDTGPVPERETVPIAQWKSPTDFLLATPGRELLSTVPAVGAPSLLGFGLPLPPPKPSTTPKGAIS